MNPVSWNKLIVFIFSLNASKLSSNSFGENMAMQFISKGIWTKRERKIFLFIFCECDTVVAFSLKKHIYVMSKFQLHTYFDPLLRFGCKAQLNNWMQMSQKKQIKKNIENSRKKDEKRKEIAPLKWVFFWIFSMCVCVCVFFLFFFWILI